MKHRLKSLVKRALKAIPYVSRLDQENQALHQENQALRQENQALRQENQALQQENQALQAKLNEYEAFNLDLFRAESKTQDERNFTSSILSSGLLEVNPAPDYPETFITIKTEERIFREKLLYGHLGLAKLVTEYEFNNILDIGSRNGTASKAFKFLNKDVTTIEFSSDFLAEYTGDYLDVNFPNKFDAIWCSHVLEHQRNVGIFLEKIFGDLKEGGVLAITVPSALSPLIIGHPNIFTPLHLIYHLVLAGFNCSEAKIKCYDWQFTILVRKESNHIKPISFASTHHPDISDTGVGFVENLLDYFPVKIPQSGHIWGEIESLNWD